jgi:glycosyltransferase involved in cell wall biosynthesis
MKIPILFTIPNFITAGSGRAMLNIVERLDREFFAPVICVARKGGSLDREVERLGIPLIEAPFTVKARPYSMLPVRAWSAARLFRAYNFKIWHSFHYLDDYTEPLIARFAGVKTWVYTKKNMSWGNRAWWLRSRFATAIAAQNSSMIELFFRSIPTPVRVIPPSVDTRLYFPASPSSNARAEWGIPEDAVVVGHVAHLVPVKNHPHLIRALTRCQSPIHLVLAGRLQDACYVESVRRLAADLQVADRVHLVGEVQNIPEFLRSLDIFAFCSHQEACPVAVLEAMACGLPCVVTNIPGIRDAHIPEETAVVVPPGDVEAFAAGLDTLAASPFERQRMGQAAAIRIQERFSIEREVAQYINLYQDVIRAGADISTPRQVVGIPNDS